MVSCSLFKNTFLFSLILLAACGNSVKSEKSLDINQKNSDNIITQENEPIKTGAENYEAYLHLLEGKKIGVVTNQTGIIPFRFRYTSTNEEGKDEPAYATDTISIVDFFLKSDEVVKIFAPEHGFRGTADAGELIKDGKDVQTGLPIISLYGNNKKPKPEQLEGIDIMVFDLQDVGARFYTYISSLHYVMEACAENNIPLIVLDRPNPNGGVVDGPILEKEYKSFVGMHPIPVLHGMTIGEYAKMINGEEWLNNGVLCQLTVVPCLNYSHDMEYHIPVKPSPNLPNDQAIALYPSLCFFEGTNVSVGRGTDMQFQVFGSPYLPKLKFSFIPQPNEGAKNPLHNGKICNGVDLRREEKPNHLKLEWLIKAYNATEDKSSFFNNFFVKLAGTATLQKQIEEGKTETQIRKSWNSGLKDFRATRKKYLIYD